jgi:hypothetical protein
MRSRRLSAPQPALALALAALMAVAAACKKPPRAGAACTREWATECTDQSNAVTCVSGRWESIACRSVTGCMDMGEGNDSCSNDSHNVGEPCKEEGNYGCSPDQKAMLKCDSKRWTKIDDCNGQHGCVSNATGAKCDKGTESAGASCTPQNEGNGSCTPDGKSLLVCRGGKMVVAALCKGMHGCRQLGNKLECNQTIADVGDPCEDYEGKFACSSDKKSRLVCRNAKMVKDRTCKSCSVLIDEVQCQ